MAAAMQLKQPTSAPAQVELILAQIDALPTLPAVAMRLVELTGDKTSSARHIIEILESDPSLASRILAVARRADLGATAATLDRAVVLLGFQSIRSLVLSMQVFETFSQRVEKVPSRLDLAGLWKHSLAVGCAARLLVEALGKQGSRLAAGKAEGGKAPPMPQPEEAFVCGLLHDLGKVALNACFPKSYDRVVVAVDTSRSCIADLEQRVFGLDHSVAGRRLAAHWKLPAQIGECIWLHHHRPESTPTQIGYPLHVRVVQIADRLVRHMQIGYSGNYTVDGSVEDACREVGISTAALKAAAAELPELIEARAGLIGLERLTSKEVYSEALVFCNSELARLNVDLATAQRRLEQRCRWFEALASVARQSESAGCEEICRTLAEAAGSAANSWPVAVAACGRSQSFCTIAHAVQPGRAKAQSLPRETVGNLEPPAQMKPAWLPTYMLPPELLDRLSSILQQAPSWWWPIRSSRGFFGAIVYSGDPRNEPEDCVTALAEAAGRALEDAEGRQDATRLMEELAEMNRRLDASQSELARARCLSVVGEMAAGAAHELNNPLAVISGRAQLLAREGNDDEVRRAAAVISENAHRASQMVSELMEFAKPAPPQAARIILPKLLEEIRGRWIEKGEIAGERFRLEISDALPDARADAAQITVLFDELISNAIQAMQGISEPLLVVNCRSDVADEEVVISVADNGCGMAPEVMERAMAPFFSHRQAGRGRGLGLSRAARYAEINGGRIRLAPAPGGGTLAIVTLPAMPPGR